LPPAHLFSSLGDRAYSRLIGLRDEQPTIAAECLFADPVGDIAVLGCPDNQALSDEADAYENFIAALPPFAIAPPPDEAPSFSARVMSLAGKWITVAASRPGLIVVHPPDAVVAGMSGSPIVSETGAAIGVVAMRGGSGGAVTDAVCSVLVDGLPGWLLRKLTAD
jgi:hypothetical protein